MSWIESILDNGGGATLLAAVFVTVFGAWASAQADRRKRYEAREDQILKSLAFLTGGTQSRSAGVAVLEGLLVPHGKGQESSKKIDGELKRVFLPVIRNQIIYLATTTDSKDELHEIDNFLRYLRLWRSFDPSKDETAPLISALSVWREIKTPSGPGLQLKGSAAKEFEDFCKFIESGT